MPDNSSLELHDIHLPAEPSWFPLAPGWWVVIAAFILLAVALFFILKKRNRKKYFQTEAMALIDQVIRRYENSELNGPQAISELSTGLRRIAITLYGREKVAKLSGKAWLEFLDSTGKQSRFNSDEGKALIEAAYQPSSAVSPISLAPLAKAWIMEQRP